MARHRHTSKVCCVWEAPVICVVFFAIHVSWGAQLNVCAFHAALRPLLHLFINCGSNSVWILGICRSLDRVWGHFLVDGCLGRPWGDLGRPVSIFAGFFLSLRLNMVAFGLVNVSIGRSWEYFCGPGGQKRGPEAAKT